MADSYQLIGTYGADADAASQWCGLSPGYLAINYSSWPGQLADVAAIYDVVNFAGWTEASGGGVQQLNTTSPFGSDLSDITTLLAGGAATVTRAPEFNWNGAAGSAGGDLNYSLGLVGGVQTYSVSQPMNDWGAVRNYVLDLTTADAARLGAVDVQGFESTNIKIGSGGPGAVPTIHADQVSQGYFDMSQAGAAVTSTILTSSPLRGNQGNVIVYNSSKFGGSLTVGDGDASGSYFSNGVTFDNSGLQGLLDYIQTGAGDTINLTASFVRADISLTNGGKLIGSSAWSAMVSGDHTIASLEAEVGAGTGAGASVHVNPNGSSTVDIAAGNGLTVITGFGGDAALDLTLPGGSTFTGEKSFTDSAGTTAHGYFSSSGGGMVLVGGPALSAEFAAYAHAGNETSIYFEPA